MEETPQKEVKKRGRPPLVNPGAENSYAKTGIIRKPSYLLKREQAESQAAVAVSLDGSSTCAAAQRDAPVARKFISVEAFTPRGPKPGQKRKPYKKRKLKKKSHDELLLLTKPEKGCKRSKKAETVFTSNVPKRNLRPRKPNQQFVDDLELSLSDEEQGSDEGEHNEEELSPVESPNPDYEMSDGESDTVEDMPGEYFEYEVQPATSKKVSFEEEPIGLECEEQIVPADDEYKVHLMTRHEHYEDESADAKSLEFEEQKPDDVIQNEKSISSHPEIDITIELSQETSSANLPLFNVMDPGFFDF